jgi:hypothetical protein
MWEGEAPMTMDILTVGVGFFSFGIFLLVHLIIFRKVAPEHLLRSLLACVIAIMGLPLVLMGIFFSFQALDATVQAWICAALLALVIQGLLCFFYILCIFGPYETSVRMRLVREIAAVPSGGTSLKELLQRYNHETIVDLRLRRLLGSGDIIEKDGLYRVGHSRNFFFLFDAIAGVLKRWIER